MTPAFLLELFSAWKRPDAVQARRDAHHHQGTSGKNRTRTYAYTVFCKGGAPYLVGLRPRGGWGYPPHMFD